MKKSILCTIPLVILFMFFSSCKTAEFVWNPVGTWTWTVVASWETWTENVTLSGSEASGTITGYIYCNPNHTPGTWTKTGFTLAVHMDFLNGSWHNVLDFTGTSSEANPNSMTGTAVWVEYWGGTYNDTYNMSFTAVKTSNLQ